MKESLLKNRIRINKTGQLCFLFLFPEEFGVSNAKVYLVSIFE